MSHQIIKQPNGLFCVFSTILNDFVLRDATPEKIFEYEASVENITIKINEIVDALNKMETPPFIPLLFRFIKTYEEMREIAKEVCGKDYSQIKADTLCSAHGAELNGPELICLRCGGIVEHRKQDSVFICSKCRSELGKY